MSEKKKLMNKKHKNRKAKEKKLQKSVQVKNKCTLSRTTIFVKNIPFSSTDEELLQIFEKYNPVNAKIVRQKGKSKGFGFVKFENENDLTSSLALDETMMKSVKAGIQHMRSIRVKTAFHNGDNKSKLFKDGKDEVVKELEIKTKKKGKVDSLNNEEERESGSLDVKEETEKPIGDGRISEVKLGIPLDFECRSKPSHSYCDYFFKLDEKNKKLYEYTPPSEISNRILCHFCLDKGQDIELDLNNLNSLVICPKCRTSFLLSEKEIIIRRCGKIRSIKKSSEINFGNKFKNIESKFLEANISMTNNLKERGNKFLKDIFKKLNKNQINHHFEIETDDKTPIVWACNGNKEHLFLDRSIKVTSKNYWPVIFLLSDPVNERNFMLNPEGSQICITLTNLLKRMDHFTYEEKKSIMITDIYPYVLEKNSSEHGSSFGINEESIMIKRAKNILLLYPKIIITSGNPSRWSIFNACMQDFSENFIDTTEELGFPSLLITRPNHNCTLVIAEPHPSWKSKFTSQLKLRTEFIRAYLEYSNLPELSSMNEIIENLIELYDSILINIKEEKKINEDCNEEFKVDDVKKLIPKMNNMKITKESKSDDLYFTSKQQTSSNLSKKTSKPKKTVPSEPKNLNISSPNATFKETFDVDSNFEKKCKELKGKIKDSVEENVSLPELSSGECEKKIESLDDNENNGSNLQEEENIIKFDDEVNLNSSGNQISVKSSSSSIHQTANEENYAYNRISSEDIKLTKEREEEIRQKMTDSLSKLKTLIEVTKSNDNDYNNECKIDSVIISMNEYKSLEDDNYLQLFDIFNELALSFIFAPRASRGNIRKEVLKREMSIEKMSSNEHIKNLLKSIQTKYNTIYNTSHIDGKFPEIRNNYNFVMETIGKLVGYLCGLSTENITIPSHFFKNIQLNLKDTEEIKRTPKGKPIGKIDYSSFKSRLEGCLNDIDPVLKKIGEVYISICNLGNSKNDLYNEVIFLSGIYVLGIGLGYMERAKQSSLDPVKRQINFSE